MNLKIKQMRPDAPLPGRASAGAAGYDLRACLGEQGLTLSSMERALIPTGIAIELPSPEYMALVFARSGQALKNGLTMANGVGLIDSDYRGEIGVAVINLSAAPLHIAHGERIAQMVIAPIAIPQMLEIVDDLSPSTRGAGGFGSTGTE